MTSIKPKLAVTTPGALDVGKRVRAARAKRGMTRRQLAVASGTSERYLANIEGGIGNPTLGIMADLAVALDVAMAELMPAGGERDPSHEEGAALLRRLPGERVANLLDLLRHPVAAKSKAHRIVLIGLRGAGKSALGKALAERKGLPFIEMSREVERAYGGEMGLLIELGGQGAVRRYERDAWQTIVASHESAVIATPGGVVADPMLFDRILSDAHSVWLDARPEDHMARVMAQGDVRPMASNRAAMDDLKTILEARRSDYARADARVDTSAQDFERTLARLEIIAGSMLQNAI